jgi:hypothetical protein
LEILSSESGTPARNDAHFAHIASIETADGRNPLAQSMAFKAFQTQINDRCEELPVVADLTEVGSYRFFESSKQ